VDLALSGRDFSRAARRVAVERLTWDSPGAITRGLVSSSRERQVQRDGVHVEGTPGRLADSGGGSGRNKPPQAPSSGSGGEIKREPGPQRGRVQVDGLLDSPNTPHVEDGAYAGRSSLRGVGEPWRPGRAPGGTSSSNFSCVGSGRQAVTPGRGDGLGRVESRAQRRRTAHPRLSKVVAFVTGARCAEERRPRRRVASSRDLAGRPRRRLSR
jgi:hypothetical protein